MCKEWLKMYSCSRDSVFKQRNYLKDVLQQDFVFVFAFQPFEQRIWKRIKKWKKGIILFQTFFWGEKMSFVSKLCFIVLFEPKAFSFSFSCQWLRTKYRSSLFRSFKTLFKFTSEFLTLKASDVIEQQWNVSVYQKALFEKKSEVEQLLSIFK